MSFFEKAWASRRTELSVLDVIPVLESFKAQVIDLVYPSDLYTINDLARAVRRSIHVYDIIPILDYALVSKVPAVHVYDLIPVYDYGYVSRRNVVHAYDIISQFDAATRSGNVTLSVTDILSIPEWFFRVNKALKIFEGYIPYELATASAIPAVYADDLFIIYDLGASVNAVKTASVLDKLVADSVSYTKSYSPLFFTLFQRRVPVVYKTLSVLDIVAVKDGLSTAVTKAVSAFDYVVSDSVSYTKSYSPLFFTMFQRRVPVVYKTLSVADVLALDSASVIVRKVVSVSDFIMYDYVPSMSPSDIIYIGLYSNPGTYGLSVSETGIVYDSAAVVKKALYVLDKVIYDKADLYLF